MAERAFREIARLSRGAYCRFDAGSARQVKDVLLARVRSGGTVLMTTHILEVAERMAERIGVIAAGRLIAEGTLDELRIKAGRHQKNLEDIFLTLVAEQAAAPGPDGPVRAHHLRERAGRGGADL